MPIGLRSFSRKVAKIASVGFTTRGNLVRLAAIRGPAPGMNGISRGGKRLDASDFRARLRAVFNGCPERRTWRCRHGFYPTDPFRRSITDYLRVCLTIRHFRAKIAPAQGLETAKQQWFGLVNAGAVYVRSAASEDAYPVMKLEKGAQVKVVGMKFKWLKIVRLKARLHMCLKPMSSAVATERLAGDCAKSSPRSAAA